jgi:hypothetical protein
MLVTGCNQAPFLTEHGRQSGPFDVIRPSTTTKLSPRKKKGAANNRRSSGQRYLLESFPNVTNLFRSLFVLF